ncbi:MAG: hypothetical protein CVU05_02225 [Bacteroidetes bacterium HGW-Bacteroidetes-21]|jgi:hypothetical protein|nr:MAG: hypothetical protein CVU05_02225 [Bacteroidetes bacterium HGW-Bacteroidetes-21]
MDKNISELESMHELQEDYFENLIDLGLLLESNGLHHKAFEVYKKGIAQAEKAKEAISHTMCGLMDN